MAVKISVADGNFTSADTWAVVEPNSYVDSELNQTAATSNNYAYSTVFTPTASIIDGIAVKISNIVTNAIGTVTVALIKNSDNSELASRTINCADIACSLTGTYNRGWYFFKFNTPYTIDGTTVVKVGIKDSGGTRPSFYRSNVSSTDWSRMLRTTTTGAPAANDQLHIIGEMTGQGTKNTFTVIMDNIATTSFGPTVAGGPPQGITVGFGGTLNFGTSAGTDYYLKWKGIFSVFDGGILNIGFAETPIPSSSTVTLKMDSVTNVDTGIEIGNGGIFKVYGHPKFTTSWRTLLTSNKVATNTVLDLDDTTGWETNDTIAIASTSRTNTECESKTIATVDNSTQVTLTSGLGFAHSGTAPTQAEVINLTRNITISGITTATAQGYVYCQSSSIVSLNYVEFYNIGGSGVNKTGLTVSTTVGNFEINYSSIHDCTSTGQTGNTFNVNSISGNNISINHVGTYRLYTQHIGNSPTPGIHTYNDIVSMLSITSGQILNFGDAGSTYTNLVGIGNTWNNGHGISIVEYGGKLGICSNLIGHSNAGIGIKIATTGGYATNLKTWRNAVYGITVDGTGIELNEVISSGNATSNMYIPQGANCLITNSTFAGDVSFSSSYGVTCFLGGVVTNFGFNNCSFGPVTGIFVKNTADVGLQALPTFTHFIFRDCLFNSNEFIRFFTGLNSITNNRIQVQSYNHNQVADDYRTYKPEGNLNIDTVIYNTNSPSLRLTPLSNLTTVESPVFTAAGNAGSTVTASVYVRHSSAAAGDSNTYDGQYTRLFVKRNYAAGIMEDTLIATATSAMDGEWASLSGTTPILSNDCILSFYVDCGGAGYTQGWVNIDTWSSTPLADTKTLRYWNDAMPVALADNTLGGGPSSTNVAYTYWNG